MIIIGEKINASNKSVGAAISSRDEKFIADMAKAQAEAGADFIDVNVGDGQGSVLNEAAAIEWLIEVVQAVTEKPLAIDSNSPAVIEAALRKYRGEKVLINSITAEPAKLASIGPLVAERQAWVIALAMGADRIPDNVEMRLAACEQIITGLSRLGVEAEQIFFDPLVLPIAVDSRQALVTLQTIEQIKSRYPAARTVIGLSNISFGLPARKLINRAFLLMAAYAGLDAVIIDPLDTRAMSLVKVADMLLGKDATCRAYLRAYRSGTIIE